MDKKKNVYVVLTEYQLLQSVNLSTTNYDSRDYVNIIYIIRNGRRLMGIDSNRKLILDNLQIHILEDRSPKDIANIILKENPDHFLIFQGNSPLNVFMASVFSKRGVKISLGPDGYGAYNIYKKKNPLITLIKDSIIANFYLLKNNLFNGKFHLFDYYKYGNQNFIDNIWVTHPEQFIRQTKREINILKLPDFNQKCIEFIKSCFEFNEDFPTENVIYYLNQPLSSGLIHLEFDFLRGVLKNFPNKKLILKLHPLTSPTTKAMYQEMERFRIIESSVPAEILLLSLKNCIVFTGYSSVLITKNSSCNYYFNYPIYKKSDDKSLTQSNIIVLNHITLVNTPEQMKFPNE